MAVEDISYAVEKLLEELATNSPNLTPSDMTVIKAAIAGEGRLFILTPSEAHMVGEYRWNLQVARDKWERGQDQGGE